MEKLITQNKKTWSNKDAIVAGKGGRRKKVFAPDAESRSGGKNNLSKFMKKEIVYTMPYSTPEEIKAVWELKSKLYEDHDDVSVYVNGRFEVKVVCVEKFGGDLSKI